MEYLAVVWLLFIIFGCIGLYVSFARSGVRDNKPRVVNTSRAGRDAISGLKWPTFDAERSTLPLWLYFVAIAAAELLTIFLNPWAGVICHSIILVALLIQPTFVANIERRNLILALSLVPLVRILSLSLPLVKLPQMYWYPLIYAPLLAATVVVMRVIGLKPSHVGLTSRGLPWQIPMGIVTGSAFGFIEYLILRPEPLVTQLTWQQVWLPAVILLVTSGFVEELMFRGVLQRLAESVMGLRGILYIALIFTILHVGWLSLVDLIFILFIGSFFAVLVKRTGSIIGVTLSHGIANIMLFIVMPYF